ncbi:MAG: PEP/pyruvate-binding domain-containing protein [Desulfobacca sp.]|uniref:PEP/pyruvate-binding domain-containing protein n=1 Tax=Desulfobacca sp. TaxID=2067990 RepID=UPI00404B985B
MFKFLRRFLREESDEQALLQDKFVHFRRLLDNNNLALATMADMEEKASGDFLFDTGYLDTQVQTLSRAVSEMIEALHRLSQDHYRQLDLVYNEILARTLQTLKTVPPVPATPPILWLEQSGREMAASCGAKMANLGEIRNRLRLPTPRGFVITASVYQAFLLQTDLAERIAAILQEADLQDLHAVETISQQIRALISAAALPPDLAAALEAAAQTFNDRPIAVRSSAVGEDTASSFAGQFATFLNVPPSALVDHYKAVVASKFTPQAIFYWKYQGFSLQELPMAVGCLEMVAARASGVMFSRNPRAPEEQTIIITAVWGLGKFAVDGSVSPDIFELKKEPGFPLLSQRLGQKIKALRLCPGGGLQEVALSPEEAGQPCLHQEQLQRLAALACRLEEHFQGPQDIEWALSEAGEIVLLQSRPLRLSAPAFRGQRSEKPQVTVPPLLSQGVRAVGGVAAGPVFVLRREEEIPAIPPGAVVVLRQPSSRLVQVMDRVAAILTEVGSPTDHMTILAREFQVPTLVDVKSVTQTLATGQEVTVDADLAVIYPGIHPELLSKPGGPPASWRQDPVFARLRSVLTHISPLHLLDPTSPDFAPEACQTFHDLTRFCHEKAMDAMFQLDVEASVQARGVSRFRSDLPINLFVLDLGGGLREPGKPLITEDDVTSPPFLALMQGFCHPDVRWAGQVAVDLKGFISVFANTLYDQNKADTTLGGKSFAIITDRYVNLNSRLGYHFGLVDAYVCEERNDNYITFQFKGGAASLERRERRAQLLALLLEDMGFKAQASSDLVRGRLVKYSQEETIQTLVQVGTLLAFSRQLDLALASDAVMHKVMAAFKAGDYVLQSLFES